MSYAIFFSDEQSKLILRLPVNPEKVSYTQDQNVEEFDVVGVGGLNIPQHLKPIEVNFEAEFPHKAYSYVETPNEFRDGEFYVKQFKAWREEAQPVRLIVHNGDKNILNLLVVISSMSGEERAGEEKDYYITFDLKEYRPYGMQKMVVQTNSAGQQEVKSTAQERPASPPKPKENKNYTIQGNDTLWSIAKRFLGDGNRWKEIYNINQPPLGKNPNIIHANQKIKIP